MNYKDEILKENPRIAIDGNRVFIVDTFQATNKSDFQIKEITAQRQTILCTIQGPLEKIGLATHCGQLYVTNGQNIFTIQHGQLKVHEFDGLEKPGQILYSQKMQFEYKFIQFCDKLLIKANFLYIL